jgi:hypothetical protein
VFLGWNRKPKTPAPTYTITLPQGAAARWKLNASSTLQLSVAALDEDASDDGVESSRESPDFTIELETSDGAIAAKRVSRFAAIPPPLITQFTKLELIDTMTHKETSEPVFQTARIPLDGIDPAKLSKVRLRFDVTPVSVICLSSVGFGAAP